MLSSALAGEKVLEGSGLLAADSFIIPPDFRLLLVCALHGVDPSTQVGKSTKGRPMKKIVWSLNLLASFLLELHVQLCGLHLAPAQPQPVQKKQRRRATEQFDKTSKWQIAQQKRYRSLLFTRTADYYGKTTRDTVNRGTCVVDEDFSEAIWADKIGGACRIVDPII